MGNLCEALGLILQVTSLFYVLLANLRENKIYIFESDLR